MKSFGKTGFPNITQRVSLLPFLLLRVDHTGTCSLLPYRMLHRMIRQVRMLDQSVNTLDDLLPSYCVEVVRYS
mgnify:CR=1 FL=1